MLSGSDLSVVFLFFFVSTIPVLLVLLFFPSIEVIAIILCSFSLYYFSCLNFALVSWLLLIFSPNFSFPFLFFSPHSIRSKKGLVRFPWNGGSVCVACESKLR